LEQKVSRFPQIGNGSGLSAALLDAATGQVDFHHFDDPTRPTNHAPLDP